MRMTMIKFFACSYLIISIIEITFADIDVYYYDSKKIVDTFKSDDPQSGPEFPSDGLQGYLVRTSPTDACQPIAPAPSIKYPGYQWIALIRRSEPDEQSCHFSTKIINAYRANFSAAIIYNYEDKTFPMSISDSSTHIPATLISHSDGFNLINRYLFNSSSVPHRKNYYLNITASSPDLEWPSYVIPFIAIVTMSILCLLGFLSFRWCVLRRRNTRHQRLSRSALKQLEVKKFVKTDPWEVCAICLDDFEEGAKLRILPCHHAYHMKCIDPWLINNRRQCPCCKRYVFPNLDNSVEENNHHQQTPTERTPLIMSVGPNSASVVSPDRQVSEANTGNQLITGTSYLDTSDEEKDDFSSSIPTRTTITTADLVFGRSSTDSRQYGSFNGSTSTAQATNFYVDSMCDTTGNTNVSERSIVEHLVETDHDEQIHREEDNQAFVNDEHPINSN